MRRLLIALVALAAAWFGLGHQAASAVSAPAAHLVGYTYDSAPLSAGAAAINHGRGPPEVAYAYTAAPSPGDYVSRGASVRLQPISAWIYTTYARTGQLAQVASGSGTTRTAHGGCVAEVRAVPGARCAAKYGRDIPIGPAEEDAWKVLNRVDEKGSPLPGYKGGSVYRNSDGQLPEGVTYQKWDLNQKVKGVDRDDRRLITGSDGSAYYTTDHYLSFIQIR